MPAYIALVRKEDHTDYWVDIPDIPGCVADGETLEDAMKNFEEALAFHLEGANLAALPQPRALAAVLQDEQDPHVEAYAVELDLTQHRPLKLHFARLA
jgi:predicted RNase H-like HicB family nuclease